MRVAQDSIFQNGSQNKKVSKALNYTTLKKQ